MFICPFDLDYCDRPECAGLACEKSGESPLNPCHGCGKLVVVRGIGICVDCDGAGAKDAAEA